MFYMPIVISSKAQAQQEETYISLETNELRGEFRVVEGKWEGKDSKWLKGKVIFTLSEGSTFEDITHLVNELGSSLVVRSDFYFPVRNPDYTGVHQVRRGSFTADSTRDFREIILRLEASPHISIAGPSFLRKVTMPKGKGAKLNDPEEAGDDENGSNGAIECRSTLIDNSPDPLLEGEPDDPCYRFVDDPFNPEGIGHSQWYLKNQGIAPQGGEANYLEGADIDAKHAWILSRSNPNIVIAILDSGISTFDNGGLRHPDLNNPNKVIIIDGAVLAGDNLQDRNGHGTFVAGIAAAETNNGTINGMPLDGDGNIAGVGYNARLLPIKIADEPGIDSEIDELEVEDAVLADGIDRAILWQTQNTGNQLIINISYGGIGEPEEQELRDALIGARNANVPVVTAVGNDNAFQIGYPAAYSRDPELSGTVIAVAGTDQLDNHIEFSNSGSGIDIAAPAGVTGGNRVEGILSTSPQYFVPSYFPLLDLSQGTSFAAPQVAGTLALMYPVVNGDEFPSTATMKETLLNGAEDIGEDPIDVGEGRLNAYLSIVDLLDFDSGSLVYAGTNTTGQHIRQRHQSVDSPRSYSDHRR